VSNPPEKTKHTPQSAPPLWQGVVGVLLLMAILIGINSLYEPAANWNPPPLTGDAGDVLYAAGFDAFEDEWQHIDDGRLYAAVENGMLRLSGRAGTPFSAAKPVFTDFDASVTVTARENPAHEGYGLVFRVQDPDNLYMFWISSDGYYRVNRLLNGEEKRLSTWIPSTAIEQGFDVENRIRVVGRGDEFQFFINGQQVELCVPDTPDGESTYSGGQCFGDMVTTLQDDTFSTGQLGAVINATADNMTIDFDNFIVISPQDEPVDTGNQT